jgi:hypothetical protein
LCTSLQTNRYTDNLGVMKVNGIKVRPTSKRQGTGSWVHTKESMGHALEWLVPPSKDKMTHSPDRSTEKRADRQANRH